MRLVLAGFLALSPLGVAGTPAETTAPGAPLTLGFFLPGKGARDPVTEEILRGAEIAVEFFSAGPAGREGGQRRSVRPIAAKGAGQWEAGVGELVRLVYGEGATAVLGPADGRTAHLAEQVVARAKGRFVILTPWATDPTLTRIEIPWFFRLAPSDRKQAEAILEEIHGVRRIGKAFIVARDSDYDSRKALEAFREVSRTRKGFELPERVLRESSRTIEDLSGEIAKAGAGAVVLLLEPSEAAEAARRLRASGSAAPFYGPLRLASGEFLEAAGEAAEGMVLAAPPEARGAFGERFRARFRERYGKEPAAAAAFGFDGAMVLLRGLGVAHAGDPGGPKPLFEALRDLEIEGLTGFIDFDDTRDRAGPAPLARVEKGRMRGL